MAKKKPPTELAPIILPPIDIQHVTLRIVGDSPLICHAWSRKAMAMMLGTQQKKARGARPVRDPFRDFVESLYWLDEPEYFAPDDLTSDEWDDVVKTARFGVPAIAFKAALVDAGSFVSDFTKVQLRGAFHVASEMIQIIGTPTARQDMVRVGMGSADLRFRGQFAPWSAAIKIDHNPRVLSVEQLMYLANVGGFSCGLGEWRPQKDGSYGRFHVE